MKNAFIVTADTYWGRGATIREAATRCKAHGGRMTPREVTTIYFVAGDDVPEVNGVGGITCAAGAHVQHICTGLSLARLLKFKD